MTAPGDNTAAGRPQSAGARYRTLLEQPGAVLQPSLADPLAARIAEDVGYRALSIGGYAMGARTAMTEPLLSLSDVADITRQITSVCALPLMVDAGAGWGEPMHVMHTVRTLEGAGAAALHIEDQRYPKRAHYHKGVEQIVELDAFLEKVRSALTARLDPTFVICARTDAMRTDGYDEGIRRAAAAFEVGADLVMIFPNNDDETRRAPQDLPGVPLVYVNSTGNDHGRPVYPVAQLQTWGWTVVYDSISVTNVAFAAVHDFLDDMLNTGIPEFDREQVIATRKSVERTIGLESLYALEAATVKR